MELVYTFKIRRKTLFYTVNLIIPTVLISFLSIFVFYLPTDEGEKMTLCISILLALVVFLLLVSKILPPTSMVIPLISKYLIFTLMMNIITILNTVIIINWNYRTPRTHNMPQWVRIVIIDFLPKILFMKRPKPTKKSKDENDPNDKQISRTALKLSAKETRFGCENSRARSPLNKSSYYEQDSCSTKDEITIPIIKSEAVQFLNQPNQSYSSSLPRLKQQQHKKLDMAAANLTNSSYLKRKEHSSRHRMNMFSDGNNSDEDFLK